MITALELNSTTASGFATALVTGQISIRPNEKACICGSAYGHRARKTET